MGYARTDIAPSCPALCRASTSSILEPRPQDVDGRVKPGHDELADRYQPRVAAASQPNTLKTIGLRSRWKISTSRAAPLSLSQTSAKCASRPGSARAAVTLALSQSRTASTN